MSDMTGCFSSAAVSEEIWDEENEIDITDEFFERCKDLKVGELAKVESFQLLWAMSAIELMDPKMDIGINPVDPSIRLPNLISSGRLNLTNMDERELIATMDAMLAALITWLEGNNMAQTFLTCVLFTCTDLISDKVLRAYCLSILELASFFRQVVRSALIFDEDFQSSFEEQIQKVEVVDSLKFLKLADRELQQRMKDEPGKQKLFRAIQNRISFLSLFRTSLLFLVHYPEDDDDDCASQRLEPNFTQCSYYICSALPFIVAIEGTIDLGLQPKNNDDGNFSWLPSFEPDFNRERMPAILPRKIAMKNRLQSVRTMCRLCRKIDSMCTDLPRKVNLIEDLIDYFRSSSLVESCTLSRSLLTCVYFPNHANVLGQTPLISLIADSMQVFALPPILDLQSTVLSLGIKNNWDLFMFRLEQIFRHFFDVLGYNPARKREKIALLMEDFSELKAEAKYIERCFNFLFSGRERSMSGSLTCFVVFHALSFVQHYFYLSFYLDLFVSFEYTYVYWYLSDVLFKSIVHNFQYSIDLIVAADNNPSRSMNKGDRKKSIAVRNGILSKKRNMLTFFQAQMQLSEALTVASIGFVNSGKIRIPEFFSEQACFEHRLKTCRWIEPNEEPVKYSQYLHDIKKLRACVGTECFALAATAFDEARIKLDSLRNCDDVGPDASMLSRICKINSIVTRILSTSHKTEVRL